MRETVGILVMFRLVTLTLMALLFSGGCSRPSKVAYTFALPMANGLKEKSEITFLGVQVGYVANIRLAATASNIPPGIIATGYITNPQMRLLLGDTARIVTVKPLAEPELEIVRDS